MSAWSLIYYGFVAGFWTLAVFLGWRVHKAVRARRHVTAAVFVALIVALLWGGLLIGFTPGSSAYADYRLTRSLFGTGFVLGRPFFQYDSVRAFNGDGYSIAVYRLADGTARRLSTPAPVFFQRLPTKPSYRSRWEGKFWRPTPISTNESQFLEFALMESVRNPQLESAQKLLERLAHEPEHYYGYFYFMHDKYPGNIDFFLLSPKEHVFILVNHNT